MNPIVKLLIDLASKQVPVPAPRPLSEKESRERRIRRLTEDAVAAERKAADREARAMRRRLSAQGDGKRRSEHLKRAQEHDIERQRHLAVADVARKAAAELATLCR